MSEQKRKNFSGQYKAKVALEAIRGVKTVNEIVQEFGVSMPRSKWKISAVCRKRQITVLCNNNT